MTIEEKPAPRRRVVPAAPELAAVGQLLATRFRPDPATPPDMTALIDEIDRKTS